MSRDSSWFQHGSPLEKTVRHGQRFVVYGNIKDTPVPPTLPHIQVWSITRKGAYVSKWAVGVSDTETTGCQTYENRDHRGRVNSTASAGSNYGSPKGVRRDCILSNCNAAGWKTESIVPLPAGTLRTCCWSTTLRSPRSWRRRKGSTRRSMGQTVSCVLRPTHLRRWYDMAAPTVLLRKGRISRVSVDARKIAK
ncbi:hypothetical protein LIA77_08907 [Sarocladium implicatum]|nr:hypothetical protein LIA77_08907 [Sarocladium implicatum]